MNRDGVISSIGAVYGCLWGNSTRPRLDPRVASRELQIIHDHLHCNAVRVSGRLTGRSPRCRGLASTK